MSGAYYNEFNPEAAYTLENLIKDGLIAPGQVDTRSIEDVRPDDLRGFTQCHFFAGFGVWSYALRRAGWSDDRPVWTGSCPCQPFSAAGKGAAFADERHLWPAFDHLIKVGLPPVVFGEQVASAAVDDWIDLVHADLEALGYAFGCVPFSSAGVGAPHIRDRAYWMAYAGSEGSSEQRREWQQSSRSAETSLSLRLADHARQRWSGWTANTTESAGRHGSEECGAASGLAYANLPEQDSGWPSSGEQSLCDQYGKSSEGDGAGPVNGWWRDADWIGCTDGFWRPVEPGAFPLADGVANRMGKLRAFGNAINAQQAQIFVEVASGCIR